MEKYLKISDGLIELDFTEKIKSEKHRSKARYSNLNDQIKFIVPWVQYEDIYKTKKEIFNIYEVEPY